MKIYHQSFLKKLLLTLVLWVLSVSSLVFPNMALASEQVCPANMAQALRFVNPVTLVNRGGRKDHVYRFSNVLTGVDAKVTVVNTRNAYIHTIDSFNHNPPGYNFALQPDVKVTNMGNGRHYVDLKIEFLSANTNNPYNFPSNVKYTVSGLDVDGNDIWNSKREFVGLKGFKRYYLESNTNLVVQENNGFTEFLASTGVVLNGISTSGTRHIVTTEYGNDNVFYYRTGIQLQSSGDQQSRYFSIYFDCITYNDPIVVGDPPPTEGDGTLRRANSGLGEYKDRILFMDWKDSSLEDGIQQGDIINFDIPASSCMANGTLTATFSTVDDPNGIAAETKPKDMRTWGGASFHQLYNTVGLGEAIYTPQISPSNTSNHLGFTIDWNMVIDGQSRSPDIFLMDAESTTEGYERIDVTTNGGVWSIIENALNDIYVVDGIGSTQIEIKNTEDPNVNDSDPDDTKGFSPLLLSKQATSTSVTMRTMNSNGWQGVAFGLLAPCDYGDAPSTYGDAGHAFFERPISASKAQLGLRFKPGTPYFGATPPDSEASTQQDASPAEGDDNHEDAFDTTRSDDEDIVVPQLPVSQSVNITVPINGSGYLHAWFDWNADGDFGDVNEHVATNVNVNTGNTALTVNIPEGAVIGESYARFRISTEEDLASTGYAKDGEVEDVLIEIIDGVDVCTVDDLSASLYATSSVSANSGLLSASTRTYQAKFNRDNWLGHVLAYNLETADNDGNVKALQWDAANELPRTGRKMFTYNPYLAVNRGILSLWSNLDSSQQAILKNGKSVAEGRKLWRWAKGRVDDEGTLFRARTTILGDIINSNLLFKDNYANYGYSNLPEGSTYATFLGNKQSTTPAIFVGANDGMLHAFNASDGSELFAYIPHEILPKLVTISDKQYGCSGAGCLEHEYLVDGKSSIGDAYFASSSDWHTVLVGGLGKGGKGLFALDVSEAENFTADDVLWEISSTQATSAGADAGTFVSHLGETIPSPSVVRLNNSDASKRWAAVIGNGYGAASHQAVLFIIDVENGTLIKAINTGSGTEAQPNGLSSPVAIDSNNDSIVDRIYAGDLLGNLWAFDVAGNNPSNWGVDFSGTPLFTASQAITAPPQVGRNPKGGLMVYFGTGRYFDIADNIYEGSPVANTYYGIHDNGFPVTSSTLVEQTILQEAAANGTNYNARVTSDNPVNFTTHHGWFMDLPEAGERVISQALLRHGRLIFTTMTPPGNVCAWGGTSWLMEFDAVEGKRLDVIPIDINDDKEFTEADNVTYQGNKTILSGVQNTALGVVFSTPAVISHGSQTEGKYLAGTGGSIGMVRESASNFKGRVSWRQIR